MHTTIASLLAISLLSPAAYAWGAVGHATVATIAQKYLTSQAQTYVSGLLGSGVTMASVASWADDYRYTTAGRFSAGFHYVDAEDNPPSSCSVSVARDCSGSCILTAIANYVSRPSSIRDRCQVRVLTTRIPRRKGSTTTVIPSPTARWHLSS